jgi:vancomycin resistance protein YoaR
MTNAKRFPYRPLAWVLAGLVVFVACGLLGFEVAVRDRIMPGIRVLGVPVGGLTIEDATRRLGARTAAIVDQPIEIKLRDRSWFTSARKLGLGLDPAELAHAAYNLGHSGPLLSRLRAQLATLWADTELTVSQASDGAALDALLTDIASDVQRAPQSAQLDLASDGAITFVASHPGLDVDRNASRAQVIQAVMEGQPNVVLEARTLVPALTTEQLAAADAQLKQILRDPVSIELRAAERTWTIDRGQLLELLELLQPDAANSVVRVAIQDPPLEALLLRIADEVRRDAQDARFALSAGQPSVLRPSRAGRALNQVTAADIVKAHILKGERTVELPVDMVPPAVATEDAARFSAAQLIDQSTTAFAGAIPEKARNIRLAAERLNGVVVPPGGTFSFNKEVGPTTLEAGFQWGFGLTSGAQGGVHTVPSVAGGICQVATTLFQSVFWAGYQLEERFWHLYWIPAYTSHGIVGLDATVDSDARLDFKWINPTRDPVLIQASTDPEHISFRLYGTKPAWTVKVDDPMISQRIVADPTPEVQEEPSLPWGRVVPVETARDGFQVLLVRQVIPSDGSQIRELSLKSEYAPSHTVTLVGTHGAPDAGSVASTVEQVQHNLQAAAGLAPARSASSGPPMHPTPNGPRTLAQIRDELRSAGWGGGSDQDALETYRKVAAGH